MTGLECLRLITHQYVVEEAPFQGLKCSGPIFPYKGLLYVHEIKERRSTKTGVFVCVCVCLVISFLILIMEIFTAKAELTL